MPSRVTNGLVALSGQVLSNVCAIATGGDHSLALQSNGTVVAWGGDNAGQASVPPDLTQAVAVAAGPYHSVALKSDGTVVAWGANDYHQTNVPVGLTNILAIAASGSEGANHTLALRADGTVVGWGDNFYGQTNVPAGMTNFISISVGSAHNAAILAGPAITSFQVVAGQPTLGFHTFLGRQYSAESSPKPSPGDWTPLEQPNLAGDGTNAF